MEMQGLTQGGQIFLKKKNKVGEFILPDFKLTTKL